MRRASWIGHGIGADSFLRITWVENGSIWLSLASGSKAALDRLAQLFETSMDARLRKTLATAASAEEDAAIMRLTRAGIANAKNREQERLAAESIKKTRREWQQTLLSEVDFRRGLIERISDPELRAAAQSQVDLAIAELAGSTFMPVIEHVPVGETSEPDAPKLSSPVVARR